MDAFFASVEQRDHPQLKGKPIVVGGRGGRGVVAAASYEARQYGVRSAMPSRLARQKCPHLIFVPHRFDVYKSVSQEIRSIFYEYTDLVEPLSLDEAYLDVTTNKPNHKSAIYIAQQIRKRIYAQTQLTASAGVSINKFLAKVASDINKPDGLKVILPEEVDDFMKTLPIEKFFGVGKVTAQRLKAQNIHTGKDLQKYNLIELVELFGKLGKYLHEVIHGNDNRMVKSNRLRKSFSIERTFDTNLETKESILAKIQELCLKLHRSMQDKGVKGKTVNLKFRYADFTTYTRSKSFMDFMDDLTTLQDTACQLFINAWDDESSLRLIGIGYSKLNTEIPESQLQFPF